MARETELKYSVSIVSFEALRKAERIGEFVIEESERREVHDVYADTRDRAISRAGFAFRIRRRGAVTLACLKSVGRGEGRAHDREEHETEIGSALSPEHWPEGETRDLYFRITGGEPVSPEVEIRQTRVKRLLKAGSYVVAELSLDEVRFQSGSNETTVFELEVELLEGGNHEVLEHLHTALIAAYELHPVETSKFERALVFRDGPRD